MVVVSVSKNSISSSSSTHMNWFTYLCWISCVFFSWHLALASIYLLLFFLPPFSHRRLLFWFQIVVLRLDLQNIFFWFFADSPFFICFFCSSLSSLFIWAFCLFRPILSLWSWVVCLFLGPLLFVHVCLSVFICYAVTAVLFLSVVCGCLWCSFLLPLFLLSLYGPSTLVFSFSLRWELIYFGLQIRSYSIFIS